jgi:hypothetical protein
MSINSPSGALPVREMLTRTRPICGAALGCGRDLIDVVGSHRSAIDPPGHAVLQANPRAFCDTRRMRVDVDQAWGDDLAARIDGIGGIARDVSLDRGDLARNDRHVTAGERRGRRAEELAPIHHGPPFPTSTTGVTFITRCERSVPSPADDAPGRGGRRPRGGARIRDPAQAPCVAGQSTQNLSNDRNG